MKTIKAQVELRPFTVPNYVLVQGRPGTRQKGIVESPKYALHELDDATLHDLCNEFTEAVMAKAYAGRKVT